MHLKDIGSCLQHSVTITDGSGIVDVLYFDGEMFSLSCVDKGFTYRALDGTLFHTTNHTITESDHSDTHGNIHYVATRVGDPPGCVGSYCQYSCDGLGHTCCESPASQSYECKSPGDNGMWCREGNQCPGYRERGEKALAYGNDGIKQQCGFSAGSHWNCYECAFHCSPPTPAPTPVPDCHKCLPQGSSTCEDACRKAFNGDKTMTGKCAVPGSENPKECCACYKKPTPAPTPVPDPIVTCWFCSTEHGDAYCASTQSRQSECLSDKFGGFLYKDDCTRVYWNKSKNEIDPLCRIQPT